MNFLSSLDKTDAQLFTHLCKFGWMIGGVVPLIYDVQAEIYNKSGIHFTSLKHLDSIGLIQFESLSGYRRMKLPKRFTVAYYGSPTVLELSKETDNELNIGHVLLTKVGEELAPICGSELDTEFREYVLKKWKEMGYIKEEEAEQKVGSEGTPQ